MKLSVNPKRYCPECDNYGLEITEDLNIYECRICGSVWQRLKPLNVGNRMADVPTKLKKLFPEADRPFEKKIFERRFTEFDLAWEEFFSKKTTPKNDDEDIAQQKEFSHWYNYLRKQRDTNLTPKEMLDAGMDDRMMKFIEDREEDDF